MNGENTVVGKRNGVESEKGGRGQGRKTKDRESKMK